MSAEQIAFNPNVPQDERLDALGALQQAHMPTASDLMPTDLAKSVINEILDGYAEADLRKAINPKVVPFPSKYSEKGDRGMQSVKLDNWQLSLNGDYWERPSALGFDSMRMMVEQTPVLNAVVMTRVRQVMRFARVTEGFDTAGFEIRHIDRKHSLEPSELESIQLLNRFFSHNGWEFLPRKRKALRRDSFSQFMAKVARDSLTMDSVGIELEWKNDKRLGLDGFYAVDGSTIRLCTEVGYRGDDEIYALQVVQGRISTAYTFEDLIYEARNPRSDVRAAGYGISETELLVRVVTGFLNAMTYNIKGFDSNAIPKGMLHLSGSYSQNDVEAFKRYWNAMVRGVNNSWSLPVMVSKDQESKASFERFGIEFNEMYFSKWMTFLTSIICAIYGMSPSEINFDSFTGGSTSALSGSDTAEKLAASKDSGLRPLLAYFENLFTDYITAEFSDKYVFRWTGLDPDDAQTRNELRKTCLTINELRAEEGYEALDASWGDAPVSPAHTGIWMQLMQQDQQQDQQPQSTDGADMGQGEDSGADFGQGEQPAEGGGAQDQDEGFGQGADSGDFGKVDGKDQSLGKSFGLPPVYSIM